MGEITRNSRNLSLSLSPPPPPPPNVPDGDFEKDADGHAAVRRLLSSWV